MAAKALTEAAPESDCIGDCPHPRETFEFFGQAEAERDILKAYQTNALPQAIILGGPSGIGKATLAWRIARFLLVHRNWSAAAVQSASDLSVVPDHPAARQVAALSHADLVLLRREMNEKTKKFYSEIRTEDVRGAIHLFQQAAGAGGYRICIVDSAEDLNRSGANALLKTIEEPPPKSLFLIISHKPDSLLPTIRSRCRRVLLKPLADHSILKILDGLKPDASLVERQEAAARSQGSLHDALRLLNGQGVAFDKHIRDMLEALPQLDWLSIHALADQIAGRDGLADYETLMITILDWLAGTLRTRAEARDSGESIPLNRLAPLAEVWEKVAEAARETEVLNLDKRPLVLSIFADLAAAAGAGRA